MNKRDIEKTKIFTPKRRDGNEVLMEKERVGS